MKKKILISLLLIVSSLLLIGCSNFFTDKNTSKETQNNGDLNSIPPTDENNNNDISNENTNDNQSNSNTNNENDKEITKKTCRIYAFNREELQLYYFDEELIVEDNALVTALTKALQNTLPNDSFLALSDKAQVTSAKLDSETGLLTIVFSEDFIKDMTLGTSTESGLLSSLVNTYAYNYNVDKVAIYFGDTLYTSLKGTLDEGYFDAHFDDAKEYIK